MLVSYVLLLAAKLGCQHILSGTALGAGGSHRYLTCRSQGTQYPGSPVIGL